MPKVKYGAHDYLFWKLSIILKDIVYSVPLTEFYTRTIKLPKLKRKELKKAYSNSWIVVRTFDSHTHILEETFGSTQQQAIKRLEKMYSLEYDEIIKQYGNDFRLCRVSLNFLFNSQKEKE